MNYLSDERCNNISILYYMKKNRFFLYYGPKIWYIIIQIQKRSLFFTLFHILIEKFTIWAFQYFWVFERFQIQKKQAKFCNNIPLKEQNFESCVAEISAKTLIRKSNLKVISQNQTSCQSVGMKFQQWIPTMNYSFQTPTSRAR